MLRFKDLLHEGKPPGFWGDEWVPYMLVHHPKVPKSVVFGMAWKHHKSGKPPAKLSKPQPTGQEYKDKLGTLRKTPPPIPKGLSYGNS